MLIEFIEPGDDFEPIVVRVSEEDAIKESRSAFSQGRPGVIDPRTDAEALDEFIMVNWAIRVPDSQASSTEESSNG